MADHHEITTLREKWRFECPREDVPLGHAHTNWFPIDGKFRCRQCERARNVGEPVDPDYEHLRDKRTGDLVTRAQITLAIAHDAPASAD